MVVLKISSAFMKLSKCTNCYVLKILVLGQRGLILLKKKNEAKESTPKSSSSRLTMECIIYHFYWFFLLINKFIIPVTRFRQLAYDM